MSEEAILKLLESYSNVKDEKKKRLLDALKRTIEIKFGDTNYLLSTLSQRVSGISAGSWFEEMAEEDIIRAILDDDKELSEFIPEEGAGIPICTYYSVELPGKNGIRNLDDLPEDSPLYLTIAHAGTGKFDVCTSSQVEAKDEEKTTLILGPEDGIGEVLFTLHPGLPIKPSDLKFEDLIQNPLYNELIEKKVKELEEQGRKDEDIVLQITKEQAKALGFDMAKLLSESKAKSLEEAAIDARENSKNAITLSDIKNHGKELDD